MDNTTPNKDDSNTTGNSEGFSIPVSTSGPTITPNAAPFVSDFKSTSIAPSSPAVKDNVTNSAPDNIMATGSVPSDSAKTENLQPNNPTADSNLDSNKTPANSMPPMASDTVVKPKLSAPIRAQNYSDKGSRLMTIVLVILLALVVVGGVYGVYGWQHNKVTQLTSENSALNAQLSTVQNELKAAQKLATTPPTTPRATSTSISFSALGISLNLPNNTLANITMQTNPTPTKLIVNGASVSPIEVKLSTLELSSLDGACSTANAALGVISKTPGTYPTSPTSANSSGSLIEQFSGYYIAYSAPLACSKTASVNTAQTALVKDLESALVSTNITTP